MRGRVFAVVGRRGMPACDDLVSWSNILLMFWLIGVEMWWKGILMRADLSRCWRRWFDVEERGRDERYEIASIDTMCRVHLIGNSISVT